MDSALVKKGFDFSRKRKKWILVLGLIGFSSYGTYKLYHNPSVARKRKRIARFLEAMASVADVVSDSADTIDTVSKDLKQFLNSESDEIPKSLKQLSKIARSNELSDSLTRVSKALTVGILTGYEVASNGSKIQETGDSNFGDRALNKLMSSAGTGFVSAIVGSFARNLVSGFYDSSGGDSSSSSVSSPGWVTLVKDDKCRAFFADCIHTFVSTLVAVYLDKTMDMNIYDELFSGLTNPKHQKEMKDVLISLCNGAVETLVKTSHKVLTSSGSNDSFLATDGAIKRRNPTSGSKWVDSVSSTLAVPSNRRLVLDVTGRVTFETVRSVIEVFLVKVTELLKRSVDFVFDEVSERGFEVARFVGAKSSVIVAVCLALLLHILGNGRTILPA